MILVSLDLHGEQEETCGRCDNLDGALYTVAESCQEGQREFDNDPGVGLCAYCMISDLLDREIL
jgi:hypothetical protein